MSILSLLSRRPRGRSATAGVLAACLVLILGSTMPVYAGPFVITPTFDSSITSDPNAAAIEATINTAISTYASLFTNPITVKIYFQEMSSGLGQSTTSIYNIGYGTFRSDLATQFASSGNSNQGTALANLPSGPNNPVTGSTGLNVSSADGRALGLNTPGITNGSYDGVIGLNTSITFPAQPDNGSKYSLLAVTEHEIDEVLGTGSDVGGTGFFANPAAEDLYRFAGNSTTRNYTTSGDNAYFSINGGNTDLVQFNQSGGGADYGDWHTSGTPLVQDAVGTPGATPTILNDGGAEQTALNVLGNDFQGGQGAVPEPASMTLMGAGALLLSGYAWRRRKQNAAASVA